MKRKENFYLRVNYEFFYLSLTLFVYCTTAIFTIYRINDGLISKPLSIIYIIIDLMVSIYIIYRFFSQNLFDSLHEWRAFPFFACKNNATLCQIVVQARKKIIIPQFFS